MTAIIVDVIVFEVELLTVAVVGLFTLAFLTTLSLDLSLALDAYLIQ